MRMPRISPRTYYVLTIISLVIVIAIIVTGAAVRLSNSGMGCPNWPNCEGATLIGLSNPNQAIESLNRAVTGLVSIWVIVVAIAALWRRPYRRDLLNIALYVIGGIILQIVIGGIVVLSHVQYTTVSVHFLISELIVALGVLLVWKAGEYRRPSPAPAPATAPVRSFARVVFGWAIVVLCLGTIATSTGPHPGDAEAERLPLALATATRVHSIAALVLVALAAVFVWVAWRERAPRGARNWAAALIAVLVLQAAVGYWQWFERLPPVLVGVHILLATIAWLCVVAVNLEVDPREREEVAEAEPAQPVYDGGL